VLLPLTYRVALDAQRRAAQLKTLQPEIRRLRQRHEKDATRLATEHARLLRRHGVTLVDGRSILRTIMQMPFFVAMYSVVRGALASGAGGRFLWIPNIARSDAMLALLVAGLTYAVGHFSPQMQQQGSQVLVAIPAVITFVVLLKLSAGLGLYWGASTLVGALQNILLRREPVAT
jgi:YidC/Oxa1 family membrane protein insertase